jgi:hypothetical protein
VGSEARVLSGFLETEAASSLGRLRKLFTSMAGLPYRKTVVVVSGGLAAADRASGRPDVRSQTQVLGQIASAAGINLYIVQLDTSFFEAASIRSKDPAGVSRNQSRETQVLGTGLGQLAGDTGAALFTATAGTGDLMFDRVLRETASYYLLGVAPEDMDRDGKLHFVRVSVDAPHATVRSRSEVIVPRRATQ